MVEFFTVLFCISFLFLICSCFTLKNSPKILKYPLLATLIAASISCLCHITIIHTQNYKTANIAYNIFFISIDLLVFFIYKYTLVFTKNSTKFKILTKIFAILFVLDVVAIIVNIPLEYMFNLIKIHFDNDISFAVQERFIFKIHKTFYYNIHLFLNYIVLALTLFFIVKKLLTAPTPYKFMYRTILFSLLVVIIGDAFYVFIKIPIDFSIIFYTICAVCLCLFMPSFVPPKLLSKQLQNVVRHMKEAVEIFDNEMNYIYSNKAMEDLNKKLGFELENELKKVLVNNPIDFLVPKECEKEINTPAGTFYLQISINPVKDKKQRFMGIFVIIHDKTKEVERVAFEHYRATHDMLTGIFNRETFYEKARFLLTENPCETFLLVCSDIDNFKFINDLFGKTVGDDFLRRIADIIKQNVKKDSIYARLDNDHFVIILNKKNFNETLFVELTAQISYITENLLYPVNIHMGVYEIEDKNLPINTMCDRALMTANTIKGNFRKKIAYYNNSIRNSMLREQKLVGEFNYALASGQFKMYLQPQFSGNEKLHGAEALVRWEHPKEGIINPNEFIPLFEKNGIITSLDLYMWELAARQLKEWQQQGHSEMYISVNISPKDFCYVDIYKTFTELVEKYEIPPEKLNLEITESAVLLNFDIQLELINKLRKYGFLIEMDDFGSGYSSLNLLKDIPFDILKIDMEFLQVKNNHERSVQIIDAIINLSKCLKMPVITEGVETQEQLNFLKQLGSDLFQGFYFSKPIPVPEFEKKYIENK